MASVILITMSGMSSVIVIIADTNNMQFEVIFNEKMPFYAILMTKSIFIYNWYMFAVLEL